ncbi:class I SAM-dependent methyltransferase family protein [Microbacteriaceae bacterium]|nr:class I SAM-dependent methyltransferase family protein [Candidatus Saccharibacteria bacterium]
MTKTDVGSAQVRVLRSLHVAGIPLFRVQVSDTYAHRRYRFERRLVRAFTGFMEDYLRRHPEMEFEHRLNITRVLTYLPPAMKVWRNYVPGGIATYHVHSPHKRKMPSGHKLDLITRGFFRHSVDGVGLRSRAKILELLATNYILQNAGSVSWLSIAGGSGQPVYDACLNMSEDDRKRIHLSLVDIDQTIVLFAKKIYSEEEVGLSTVEFKRLDILNKASRSQLLKELKPQIIDCMGIFEYLPNEKASELLAALYEELPPAGRIIFTNMSPAHPHLNVHQRALGWPGVIQRTIHDVAELIDSAHIPRDVTSVYRAEDNVYNVYMVERP